MNANIFKKETTNASIDSNQFFFLHKIGYSRSCLASLNYHPNTTNYKTEKVLQPSLSNISILHVIPTFSSNNEVHEITRQYSYRESLTKRYRNNHTHQNIPIKQCKINLENYKEVLQRCRSCKLSYQTVCKHYDNEINIDYFIQRIKLKSSIQQRIRKRI
ncbi:unnamed protein product [Adineta steineri]|uniref:Uncharacterized protein n=1 Tax=Adineta steineri TaxID=433720 RepID=A0A820BEV6_9BILA|nr:unnamed protein product [Adineta steineri]